jgi:hypothetical protein
MLAQADTNCHDIFNFESATRTHLAKIGTTRCVVPTCRNMSATFPPKSAAITAAVAIAAAAAATLLAAAITIAFALTVTVTTIVVGTVTAVDVAAAIAAAAADVTVTTADVTASVVAAAAGVNLAFLVAAAITLTQQEVEAPVDVRCRHEERRHNNQPDKRHERGHW